MRKRLLIVLGLLIVVVAGLAIWNFSGGLPVQIKNTTPTTVGALQTDQEKALGTIIYPGAKTLSGSFFEVPDSLDGVVGIYSQDLVNRYPNYSVTKRTIRQADALNKRAIVLTCSGPSGKITLKAWATKTGFTDFEIAKEGSF